MTSQQEADTLLAEHRANKGRKMTLEDWDAQVKPRLDLISAGASMAKHHARALPCKPEFVTVTQDELEEARQVLQSALDDIVAAQRTYSAKPKDGDHAAA